jgi:hypothetical protein
MSALRRGSARRGCLLVSAGSVPRRWLYLSGKHPHQGRMEALDLLRGCLAWTYPGMRAGDPGRKARQQRPDGSAHWLYRGEELLPALALPLPAARAGQEAPAQDRTRWVAAGHRRAVPRRVRSGAAALGRCRALNRRRWRNCDHWYEYPRYLFVNESADILGLCGATLDQLGVEWRFSKPNTISVAKRDAVARLDEFVGPKY